MSRLTNQLILTVGGLRGPAGQVTEDLEALESLVVEKATEVTNAAASISDLADGAKAASDVAVIEDVTSGTLTASWNSNFSYPGAAMVGSASPFLADTATVQVNVTTAGALRISHLRAGSGLSRTEIQTKTVNATAANGVNTFEFVPDADKPILQGDLIAIDTVSGGATVKQLTTAGSTLILAGASISGTQTWATAARTYAAAVTFHKRPYLVLDEVNLNEDIQEKLAGGAAVASLVQTSIATVGATAAWNANLGAPGGYLIGECPAAGTVTSVKLPITNAGVLNIIVQRVVSGLQLTNVQKISVTAPTAGVDTTFDAAALGGSIAVQAGDLIGYELLASGATVKQLSASPGSSAIGLGSAVSGTQTWSSVARIYGGTFTFEAAPKVVLGTANLSASLRAALSRPVVTFKQGFGGAAPAGWSFGGSWTHPAGGALSPAGAADMSVFAKLTQTSILHDEDRTERFFVQPQGAGAIFACGLYRDTRAILAVINDNAHTLGFAEANNGTSGTGVNTNWVAAPTVFKTVALPTLVAGRSYLVELRKNRRINTVTVHDLVSGLTTATLSDGSNDGVVIPRSGLHFGSPFVAAISGQVLVQNIAVNSARRTPRVMFIGDSNWEAPFDSQVKLEERSTQILKNMVGGNAVIAGLSGSTASEIERLLAYEIPAIKPDWIVSLFGHNEQNAGLAAWQAQVNSLMAYCQGNGINLCIGVPAPLPSRATDQIKAAALALPSWVRLFRQDLALTQNNDGVTFVPANYGSDQLHRNAVGMALEAARFAIDIPELLDVAA